jgi:hypothetical protein
MEKNVTGDEGDDIKEHDTATAHQPISKAKRKILNAINRSQSLQDIRK